MPKLKTPTITRHTEINPTVATNPYDAFAAQIGPTLYRELLRTGVPNIDTTYDNMIRQLAWESDYGRSRVARDQHNYGGYGWNGKTYTTFKDDADFISHYVNLMNRRYKNAVNASSIYEYGKALKDKGYYEDSLEHYTNSLAGMQSISRAAARHRKNNPDLYKLEETVTQPFVAPPAYQPQPLMIPTNNQYNPQPHYGTSPYVDSNTYPQPNLLQTWEQATQRSRQLRNRMMEQLWNNIQ